MEANRDLSAPLNSFSRNVSSQSGEDGIIEEILRRLDAAGRTDGWCVEFGAWDGLHLSNTYNLIKNGGYKAVLIEGDPAKHETLKKNIPQSDVLKICKFVNFDGPDNLDGILGGTPIPKDFDLLSIDIDGCDYFILESLTEYHPKVICIEFNPTIPNEVAFVQPKDFKVKQGASAKALVELGAKKGYSLVAATAFNVFLVRNDLKTFVVGDLDPELEQLRDDADSRCFLFVGYDGTILSNKAELKLYWHGIALETKKIQYLPRILRTFSTDYSRPQKTFFFLWLATQQPGRILAFIKRRLGLSA